MKLPEGWKEVELKNICVKITDGTHKTPKYIGKGIPFISTNNLDPTKPGFNFSQYEKYISKEEHKELTKRCKPEKGDILISKCGTIGRTKLVDVDYEFSIFVGLALLKLDTSKIYGKYLEILLNSDAYFDIMCKLAPGSTRKTLTIGTIEKIPLTLPPLSTQQKIVSILEKAEKAKEMRIEADELTKDFLKSVFMEMFGDRKKFEEFKLDNVCETSSGGTPSRMQKEYWRNGTIPWIKSGDLNKEKITEVDEFITELGLKNSSAKYIEPDTVLIAMYGATAGITSISKIKATTNQAVCALVPKNKDLDRTYLLYWLRSKYDYIVSLSFGGGQPNISQQVIRSLKIPLPPLPIQQKFASIVKEVEAMKEQQKHSKEQIDKLFDALMQKAFKGELI